MVAEGRLTERQESIITIFRSGEYRELATVIHVYSEQFCTRLDHYDEQSQWHRVTALQRLQGSMQTTGAVFIEFMRSPCDS